jgi:hypothetical protein
MSNLQVLHCILGAAVVLSLLGIIGLAWANQPIPDALGYTAASCLSFLFGRINRHIPKNGDHTPL